MKKENCSLVIHVTVNGWTTRTWSTFYSVSIKELIIFHYHSIFFSTALNLTGGPMLGSSGSISSLMVPIYPQPETGSGLIKTGLTSRAPSQYPKRRLSVRSRKVSKPRDWYFKLSYRFEIWQAHRQHCCRSACQVSERSDNSKYQSRGFETLRDFTEIRPFGYWDGAQIFC